MRLHDLGPEPEQLLQRVAGNGHVDQSTLRAFERDVREGWWLFNGPPLVPTEDGQVWTVEHAYTPASGRAQPLKP